MKTIIIIIILNLSIKYSVDAQSIGDSKTLLLSKLTEYTVRKLPSGEEQIQVDENRNSKILGEYERSTIFWMGTDGICNTIVYIDPISEYKSWVDKIDANYDRVGNNSWVSRTSSISVSIRSKDEYIMMVIFTNKSP